MEPLVRHQLLAALFVATALALIGCSAPATDGSGIRTAPAGEAVVELANRTVIDVRTPAETADGMIAGALNIDFSGPGFRDRIAALDRDGRYLLYCRTGNRSAQAASIMRELGFTDVVDAGGYDALVAAGAPTD
jgi:phage shock protein E